MNFNQHAMNRWAAEMRAGKFAEAAKTADCQVECYRHAGIYTNAGLDVWKTLRDIATSAKKEAA